MGKTNDERLDGVLEYIGTNFPDSEGLFQQRIDDLGVRKNAISSHLSLGARDDDKNKSAAETERRNGVRPSRLDTLNRCPPKNKWTPHDTLCLSSRGTPRTLTDRAPEPESIRKSQSLGRRPRLKSECSDRHQSQRSHCSYFVDVANNVHGSIRTPQPGMAGSLRIVSGLSPTRT